MFSQTQLKQIVEQNYDLKIGEITRLGQGFQNKQYLLQLESGDKATIRLTLPDSITKEKLLKIAEIQVFLKQKDFPVKKIYKAKSGNFFLELESGYFLQVFSFIEGNWAKPKELDKYIQISGRFLAEFHNNLKNDLKNIALEVFSLNDYIADIKYRLVSFSKIPQKHQSLLNLNSDLSYLINSMKDDLHSLDSVNFDKNLYTFLHGDYQPGNYMFSNHEISGLYDFDFCIIGPIYFDIGFGITHWNFTLSDREPDFVFQNFIKGYEEIKKLGNGEKKIIVDFVLITVIERISSCFYYFAKYANKEHWRKETSYYLARYEKLRGLGSKNKKRV